MTTLGRALAGNAQRLTILPLVFLLGLALVLLASMSGAARLVQVPSGVSELPATSSAAPLWDAQGRPMYDGAVPLPEKWIAVPLGARVQSEYRHYGWMVLYRTGKDSIRIETFRWDGTSGPTVSFGLSTQYSHVRYSSPSDDIQIDFRVWVDPQSDLMSVDGNGFAWPSKD